MSTKIATIADSNTGGNIDVTQEDDGSVTFVAGATLDGDGANGQFQGSPCYAPGSYQGPTLDVIANARNNASVEGVVADSGNNDHIGEISVACAKAIGLRVGDPHEANGGGTSQAVISYQFFPDTSAIVNGVTYPLQGS